jgi:hypothetical protein
MRQQTNTAAVISGHLKQTVWKNRHFSTDCKTKMYKICIRLVMTYGAETRAETSISKRLLRTNEMKIIRTIIGHSLRDRKRSIEIREECKDNYIVCRRMTEDRLAKIARNYKLPTWRKTTEKMEGQL